MRIPLIGLAIAAILLLGAAAFLAFWQPSPTPSSTEIPVPNNLVAPQ